MSNGLPQKEKISVVIIVTLIISLVAVYFVLHLQAINENKQKVVTFTKELEILGCTVTNMTYDEVTKANRLPFMGDGITPYTWENDAFSSIRWCTTEDFKLLVGGDNSFTSNNPFAPFTLEVDVSDIALIKESETSYVFLSVKEVPRQTIWSYEHLGVKFSI